MIGSATAPPRAAPARENALLAALERPREIAALALFRILFGALMAVSALRFLANGWVERHFVERTFYFKYWGFSAIEPGPPWVMYGLYALLSALAVCIALGLFYRAAIALFFLLFSYAELTDVTNYLNHYYLVSLLALLMCFMPLSGAYSLDVLRRPALRRELVPAWMQFTLRFQVGVVYVFAGLGKLEHDWLWYGQPLNGWLAALVDLPWIGPSLGSPETALAASWAGLVHDLSIVPLLCFRRTRAFAYGALSCFHALTSSWFNIGIFPVLMPIAATVFFAPDWPRRAAERLRGSRFFGLARRALRVRVSPSPRRAAPAPARPIPARATIALLGLYASLQLLVPLRAHLYGGNVLWHEQGMRFSWRVMLRAKHGSIVYRVRLAAGRELRVSPRRYLSSEQEREMSGQPDLILQLAHRIAREFAERGQPAVEVRADALVSLNGRPPVRLIDPAIDLARVSDGLAPARWIMPPPAGPPAQIRSLRAGWARSRTAVQPARRR